MKANKMMQSGVIALMSIFYTSFANAQPSPGIECGCTTYGYYKSPATKKFSVYLTDNAYEAYSSKKKKYRLTVNYANTPNLVTLTH